ncbi:MAG: 50S ribosomal protein L18 [Patescibacteria group bacterium]
MPNLKKINAVRKRRKARVRHQIFGTAKKPRLSIFRSRKFTYAQLINDESGKTLAAASSREIKNKKPKTAVAEAVGQKIAEKAKEVGVTTAVVDRGAYKYHGRVKAVVEAARQGGLKI